MQTNILRTLWLTILAVAEAFTIFLMLRAAAWEVDGGTVAFLLWAISPYVCLMVAGLLIEKFTSIAYISVLMVVISMLMLSATVFVYLFAMDGSSSTEALAYVFVPLYLHIGGFLLLGIAAVGSWLIGRNIKADLPE